MNRGSERQGLGFWLSLNVNDRLSGRTPDYQGDGPVRSSSIFNDRNTRCSAAGTEAPCRHTEGLVRPWNRVAAHSFLVHNYRGAGSPAFPFPPTCTSLALRFQGPSRPRSELGTELSNRGTTRGKSGWGCIPARRCRHPFPAPVDECAPVCSNR